MKREIAFLFVIIFAIIINITSVYYKQEKVFLSGNLIGFELLSQDEGEEKAEVIPASYKTLGTMSFVKEDTHEFVALGHSALNTKEAVDVDLECYPIKFTRIEKGNSYSVGSVIGLFDKDNKIGNVYKDTKYGIFGKVEKIDENYKEVETISRYRIKKGKANILTNLDLKGLQSFEVEICDIDYRDENMNIEISITDDRLIQKTGGIIQGMSGSPLMQDGKMVGVVNYVDSKDNKKAYAVFVDKLI